MKNGKRKEVEEIFPLLKADRRLLPNVPDNESIRIKVDRRGLSGEDDMPLKPFKTLNLVAMRYIADYDVEIGQDKKVGENFDKSCRGKSVNVSVSGIMVEVLDQSKQFNSGETYWLKFQISPGSMPEGYESKVKIKAKVVRIEAAADGNGRLVAFQYEETLSEYFHRRRWRFSISLSSLFIFFIVAFITLMRAENIVYFKYNMFLYLYSIIAAVFLLSRYLFGALYKNVPVNPGFAPGVSIIIPCFNEEEWISKTIRSCMNQDYPIDKLEVIVVDDCSNDNSIAKIQETIEKIHKEAERFKTIERLRLVVQKSNKGKREALAAGTEIARHELVVFVDSDSFLEPTAIRNLVQPFQDPKMGGVTGRTDVENKYTNMLTKIQAVRYYMAFRIMKAAEAYFDAVTCLSGPISCYRKDLILKHKDEWLNQKFLGHPATFGDDRSMTNFVLRTHRTGYQDEAICFTIVPSSHKVFLKQQMRWKRSWLRESLIAGKFIWKKEPLMALFFYMGLIVPIAAPVVVVYNLIIIPVMHHVFPTTFLMGLMLMALLMSFVDLFFRKSSIWIYGVIFCVYYEMILLWQMPIAWVTFWKSTWGTRMTPQDIETMEKRKARLRKKGKRDEVKEETA